MLLLNDEILKILQRLENCGYEAYLVGGCVRDSLMGRNVHDIDITTNALPEQIMQAFSDYRTVPTGIKHGTVTVIDGEASYEITSYRVDGEYSDSRRPDSVKFTSSLKEDLARRDFTINAIAMNKSGEIVDPFGGEEDIRRGIIRCVGEPEKRFTEDALRIMRAVRFASQLGFKIESNTESSMLELKERLLNISKERLRDELDKLICGENSVDVMLEYREIIAQIVPELRPCFDFDQHSKYHKYNVYEHIVRAVAAAPQDLLLRRTMLLHDLGKPPTFSLDEKGSGHFRGHARVGADMAREVMTRLRYSKHDTELVAELIAYHSDDIETKKQAKKLAAKLGCEKFCILTEVKKADNRAKRDFVLDENIAFDEYAEYVRRLFDDGACMSLSDLKVNGSDITALGYSGQQVGEILDKLLDLVIDEKLPNDRKTLLEAVKKGDR